MRVCVAVIAALCLSCASLDLPAPTPEHPYMACAVTCPFGFVSHVQHICRSTTRWMQPVFVRGEHTVRGADGMKLSDVWITDQGDFPKEDVVRGSCESFIQSQCIAKMDNPCAAHPGEPSPFGQH